MKRPLAYITAPWSNSQYENAENAAAYCRQVYDAGYSPICPMLFLSTFLKDDIPQEHKDGLDMPNTAMPTKRIASGLLQRLFVFCRMKPTSAHWYRESKAPHTTKSSRWSSGHLLNGFASLTPMSR